VRTCVYRLAGWIGWRRHGIVGVNIKQHTRVLEFAVLAAASGKENFVDWGRELADR
jgi:hypothetical protein